MLATTIQRKAAAAKPRLLESNSRRGESLAMALFDRTLTDRDAAGSNVAVQKGVGLSGEVSSSWGESEALEEGDCGIGREERENAARCGLRVRVWERESGGVVR